MISRNHLIYILELGVWWGEIRFRFLYPTKLSQPFSLLNLLQKCHPTFAACFLLTLRRPLLSRCQREPRSVKQCSWRAVLASCPDLCWRNQPEKGHGHFRQLTFQWVSRRNSQSTGKKMVSEMNGFAVRRLLKKIKDVKNFPKDLKLSSI